METTEAASDNLSAEELARQIVGYIEGSGSFDELALRVFAYQFRNIPPYQNFCRGRGVTPDSLSSWQEIPPAPAAAFKQFALSAAPIESCRHEQGGRVFHSSGTTGAETSRHYLDRPALDVYRASLRAGFARFVLPDSTDAPLPILALMPPPVRTGYSQEKLPEGIEASVAGDGAPHSSLSFMLGELITDSGGAFFSLPGWQGRLAAQFAALTEPVVVFGTAFGFLHFFDAVSESYSLPPGSRVVETGGFKGRSREISRDDLYTLFTERLGVPAEYCLSEYGMSEMASQFYDSNLIDVVQGRQRPVRKMAPPTVRTRIIDPLTGTDAAPNQPGLLAHYDICNLNSVMAIQTEDMGALAEDGDGFLLLGRAPGAVLRGCSLTAEEWEQKSAT